MVYFPTVVLSGSAGRSAHQCNLLNRSAFCHTVTAFFPGSRADLSLSSALSPLHILTVCSQAINLYFVSLLIRSWFGRPSQIVLYSPPKCCFYGDCIKAERLLTPSRSNTACFCLPISCAVEIIVDGVS